MWDQQAAASCTWDLATERICTVADGIHPILSLRSAYTVRMAYWEICLSHHVHGTLSLFDVQLPNLARGGDVLMGWNCHLSNSLGWGPGMPPSVPHEHQVNRLTYSRTVILKCMSGAVLKGVPGAAPIQKSGPLCNHPQLKFTTPIF